MYWGIKALTDKDESKEHFEILSLYGGQVVKGYLQF